MSGAKIAGKLDYAGRYEVQTGGRWPFRGMWYSSPRRRSITASPLVLDTALAHSLDPSSNSVFFFRHRRVHLDDLGVIGFMQGDHFTR